MKLKRKLQDMRLTPETYMFLCGLSDYGARSVKEIRKVLERLQEKCGAAIGEIDEGGFLEQLPKEAFINEEGKTKKEI